MNIKVIEDGEQLYVHPFSFCKEFNKNKIFYLNPDEFLPYRNNDFILELDFKPLYGWYLSSFSIFYYMFVKRVLVGFWRWFDFYRKCVKNLKWNDINFLWYFITYSVPFIAYDYPEIVFSLDDQLMVLDEESLTDTIYLVPSQIWIKNKVDQWLISPSETNYEVEQKTEYKQWLSKQIGLGIGFLVSLDA